MRKGERKKQLLEEAKKLVATRGFGAATLADLAAVAGLTPGGLARHFESSATLVRAILNDLRADTFLPLDPLAEGSLDPVGQLQALVENAVAAARKPSLGFRVLLRALIELTDADSRVELHAELLECTEPLVRVLQAGQQAGVIRRSLDASVAAWELVQGVLGYALIGPRDATPKNDTAPGPFDGLLHGVLKVDV